MRVLVAACLAPTLLAAQAPALDSSALDAPVPEVPHTTTGDIVVDGVLDEPLWRDALVLELTVETNPRENVPADVETRVYLIEDGATLYVGFDARDPEPENIRAYLTRRDSAFQDDFVGVVLDTFNDQRRAFEFFVNALGVQMDLTVDDVNGGEDSSWDAIWESAGRITDTGYHVEMAIPFSQLRFQRTDGLQTWGIDALRIHPRDNRALITMAPRERGRNCYLCQISRVRGFANAEPGRGLEITPALTASRTDRRDDALGRLVDGETESDVGLDVRWAVTPDVVANLALNPDFSQVEADVPQLDVNNQFALFFPETRPFFLEGADFFSTPINAVFTRTVADPDVGAKLTGTSGENNYGIFVAEDAVTNLLFPGPLRSSNTSLDADNRMLVARYRRNFGTNSTIGTLVTSRAGDDYENRVFGIDGRYRANDSNSFVFQALRSETEYPAAVVADFSQPAGDFAGDAVQLGYEFNTRNWFAFTNYRSYDPGFRVDTGFQTQVDSVNRNIGFGRTWHGTSTTWWNRLQIRGNANTTHDKSGQLLNKNRGVNFSLQGPKQSFVQLGTNRRRQFWDGQLYDLRGSFIYGESTPVRGFNFGMSINSGDQVDFANSRLGDNFSVEQYMNWNANRHLQLRLQRTASRLDSLAGERIFDADLVDLRITWQFNVRSFLRLTMQHQKVERNLALFTATDVDADSTTRGMQLLYSYEINPQTALFAGYSDNTIENDVFLSAVKTDRTFFLKVGYAWTP